MNSVIKKPLGRTIILLLCLFSFELHASMGDFYNWITSSSGQEADKAGARLRQAIANPERMLDGWVELPSSPDTSKQTPRQLSLREAILLALRYNANIQNAELDRIIQRYQLRLAHNEFELQYALGASEVVQKSTYNGVGSDTTHSFLASPEFSLNTRLGTKAALGIANNIGNNNYNPVLNFSVTQPLLRGFGTAANSAGLLDAEDNEWLNKLNLRQAVVDQVTQVILSYRALILSANNLKNQQFQLKEAKKSYEINEKKIEAGQLEPTGNIQQSYQIESLSLMVEQGENDFKGAAQDLLQIIGLDPDMHLSVPNDVTLKELIIPDAQHSIELALNHNTQYLAQKIALRADERAYKVAKNQQLWQLDLSGNIQSGTVNDVAGIGTGGLKSIYNGNNTTEAAQLKLTLPLHDIGRRSQLINAKIRLEKDRINLLASKRALITNIKITVNNIQSLVKRYQLAQKQVALAQKSYALEKKKQQAGISSALDVNNTQNQLLEAQSGLIGAKIAYLNQLAALQRTLGTTLDYWHIKLRYGG